MYRNLLLIGAATAALLSTSSAFAQEVETINATAQKLSDARNGIQTQTGASTYTLTAQEIENQPGGDNSATELGHPAGARRRPGFLRPVAHPWRT